MIPHAHSRNYKLLPRLFFACFAISKFLDFRARTYIRLFFPGLKLLASSFQSPFPIDRQTGTCKMSRIARLLRGIVGFFARNNYLVHVSCHLVRIILSLIFQQLTRGKGKKTGEKSIAETRKRTVPYFQSLTALGLGKGRAIFENAYAYISPHFKPSNPAHLWDEIEFRVDWKSQGFASPRLGYLLFRHLSPLFIGK